MTSLCPDCGSPLPKDAARDDFLFQCQKYEALSPVFSELTPLGTLSPSALRRALVQPALACGYRFEDEALAEEMVSEVSRERGVLPLLAFAAARLWERRDREKGLLTREAYQEIGGVGGALAQHAEETLSRIGEERAPLVRELFRNLVTAQGTRASRAVVELLSIFLKHEEERKAAGEVLRELISARLLTAYEDSVEIIHESLLSAWPRLVQWRNQDEGGALLRDQLRQAAQAWQDRGRPDDLLWSGTSYREYSLWRERYLGPLTATESAFAAAMTAHALRRRRRRRLALASSFAILIAFVAMLSLFWRQAVSEALRAEASKLLALAELRLDEDPTEALAFATVSLEKSDTEEARVFVMKALWEAPPAIELVANSQAVKMPDFSPDSEWLAAGGHASEALVWSRNGGDPIVLPGHETTPRGGIFTRWASTDMLVTGSHSMVGSRAHLWRLPHGEHVRTIDFGGPSYWQVNDNTLLVETLERGSSEDLGVGLLRSWALPHGTPVVLGRVDWKELGTSISFFAPDGKSWLYARRGDLYSRPLPIGTGPDRLFTRLGEDVADFWPSSSPDSLVVADMAGKAHRWSVSHEGQMMESVIPKPDTASFGMRPDAKQRWLGDLNADQQVRLWDLNAWRAARPLSLRRSGSWYAANLSFDSTGDWVVASTGRLSRLTFWPLGKTYPSVVDGYSTDQRPLAFSPDGKWLATSWAPVELRLWPLPGSGTTDIRSFQLPEPKLVTGLAFDPQGRYLFAVGISGRAWVVPLDGSAARRLTGFSEDTLLRAGAISPSGRQVATAFFYGGGKKVLRVWNLESNEEHSFDLPAGSKTGEALTGYEDGIFSMAFVDESTLYTAGDGGLRRWDLRTGMQKVVASVKPGYTLHSSFSADGRLAMTAERRLNQVEDCPRALLIDLRTEESRESAEFGNCGTWRRGAGALDPTGTVAATGSLDGIVRVGLLASDEQHLLLGHEGVVDSIAISPDLRWIATTGEDNTLRLWPMPDLSKPPFHTLPRETLVARLRALTNIHARPDSTSPSGYNLEPGPFPGWARLPEW